MAETKERLDAAIKQLELIREDRGPEIEDGLDYVVDHCLRRLKQQRAHLEEEK